MKSGLAKIFLKSHHAQSLFRKTVFWEVDRYTYLQCINVCMESISIHSAQSLLYWMSWQFLFLLKLLWLAYLKDASLQHSHTSLYYMLSYKQPSEQVFTFYAMLHGGWRSRYHSHRQSAAQDGQNGRLSSSFSFFSF